MEKIVFNEYFLNSDDIIYNYLEVNPIYNFPYPWSKPKIRFNKLSDVTKIVYNRTELPDIRSNDYKRNLMRKYSLSFSCSDLYYHEGVL